MFKETCSAICETLRSEFLPPPTKERCEAISEEFWNLWNFPNCIGAADGKHVEIIAPPNSGSIFFNYKKHFSTILMAVVDATYRFVFVDIGAYGRNCDSTVFSESSFGRQMDDGTLPIPDDKFLPETSMKTPCVILADEGFPLRNNIMRPYSISQINRELAHFLFASSPA